MALVSTGVLDCAPATSLPAVAGTLDPLTGLGSITFAMGGAPVTLLAEYDLAPGVLDTATLTGKAPDGQGFEAAAASTLERDFPYALSGFVYFNDRNLTAPTADAGVFLGFADPLPGFATFTIGNAAPAAAWYVQLKDSAGDSTYFSESYATAVPEPCGLALVGLGLAAGGLGAGRLRRFFPGARFRLPK